MTIINPGPIGAHENGFIPPVVDRAKDPAEALVSGINLMANVSLQLGKAVEKVEGQVATLQAQLYNAPSIYNPVASAAPITFNGTANSYLMNLGSPDQGTRWEVNALFAGLASWAQDDANNVVANDVFVLISPVSDPGQVAPQHIVWHESSTYDGTSGQTVCGIPVANTFGSRQLLVQDQENLVVIIVGCSVGSPNIGVASARVTVYQDAAAAVDSVVVG